MLTLFGHGSQRALKVYELVVSFLYVLLRLVREFQTSFSVSQRRDLFTALRFPANLDRLAVERAPATDKAEVHRCVEHQ